MEPKTRASEKQKEIETKIIAAAELLRGSVGQTETQIFNTLFAGGKYEEAFDFAKLHGLEMSTDMGPVRMNAYEAKLVEGQLASADEFEKKSGLTKEEKCNVALDVILTLVTTKNYSLAIEIGEHCKVDTKILETVREMVCLDEEGKKLNTTLNKLREEEKEQQKKADDVAE